MNRTRAWTKVCMGLAVAALSAPALAQRAHPSMIQPDMLQADPTMGGEVWLGKSDGRASRAPAGAGCQIAGDYQNVNTLALTAGTSINSASFMRADNFVISSPQTLDTVYWYGFATSGASPAIIDQISSFNTAQFVITVWPADATTGLPATTPSVTATVTPSSVTATSDLVYTGNAQPGAFTVPVYEFTATVPTTSLPAGCYWIEIRPVTVPTTPTGTAYAWRASNSGDGVNLRRTSTATAYDARGVNGFDLAFCLNFPIDNIATGTACKIPSHANVGMTNQATAQPWDGTGNATFSTISTAPSTIGGAASVPQSIADNFKLSAASTINGISFQGVYLGNATSPTAAQDTFTVTFYQDSGAPGVPGTQVAQVALPSQGTLLRQTLTVSANTFTAAGQFAYSWNATFTNPVSLPAGNYWVEVVSQNSAVRWAWLLKGNARSTTQADSYYHFQLPASTTGGAGYTLARGQYQGDVSWWLNSTPATSRSDFNGVANGFNVCTGATPLAIGSTSSLYGTFRDGPYNASYPTQCDAEGISRAGRWFTLVGDGNTVTVSTCVNTGSDPLSTSTTADTIISVYLSQNATTPCAGPFVCLGSGDDDGTTNCTFNGGATTLFIPTRAGQTYYLYVQPFVGNGIGTALGTTSRGFYYVSATTDSVPVSPVAPASSDLRNCRLDIPTGALVDTETCGTFQPSANDTCTGAVVLPLNQWFVGTLSDGALVGAGGGPVYRDADFLRLPDTAIGQTVWYKVEFRAELGASLLIGRAACSAGAVAGQFGNNFFPCDSFETFYVPVVGGAAAATPFYLQVRNSSLQGDLCNDAQFRGNRYQVRVSLAPVGACCVAGSGFVGITVRDTAFVTTADANAGLDDCTAQSGVYLGDGTTAADATTAGCGATDPANTGACCLPDSTCTLTVAAACVSPNVFTPGNSGVACTPNNCAVLVSSCCKGGDGVCVLLTAAQCAAAGGISKPGEFCTPNTCVVQAPSGVCCRGVTCTTGLSAATCTSVNSNGVTINASFVNSSNTCNGAGVLTAPCCYGNFDRSADGVQVADIFAFLSAFFSGSPFAVQQTTTGGAAPTGTPGVPDIFNFLSAWFGAGGCV